MKRLALSLAMLLSSICNLSQAAEPAVTKVEIAHLFSFLENSSCQFQRNGTWYSAKEAAGHLQTKYKYLQGKDLVSSAEKFIDRAATESSLSGKAYQIKCADNVLQTSGPWFYAALAKHRSAAKTK